MGLPIIGALIGVMGSLVQGVMQGQAAKAQAAVQNQQLRADIQNERIAAAEKSNSRLEEWMRLEAANKVNVAVNGGGMGARDYSYEQGVEPYNKKVATRDVKNIQFNSGQAIGRMKYQIAVNKFEAKVASTSAMVGAAVDGLSQIGTYMSRPGGLLNSA